jgi:hypothetical protein
VSSADRVGTCVGQPLSWLTLERYHLGELPGVERQRVEGHLEGCAPCRSCLDQILADGVLELAPLPVAARPPAPPPRWRPRWALVGAGLAAVAALVLVTVLPPSPTAPPPARIGFKGGELSLSLVRQRGTAILHEPTSFAAGDRFKVLVTCSPGSSPSADVVVLQGAQVSFPLARVKEVSCGNREPLPGAFSITGQEQAMVCLVAGEPIPSRTRLAAGGLAALPAGRSVCVSLEASP